MDPSLCEAVRAALYVDPEGEQIDEDMQISVKEHLKTCAACRKARDTGEYSI